jgi:pyruvate kinase
MNTRKTKIVCTIGPKTWDKEPLRELALNGMNVARLNMSHGDHEQHARTIQYLKEINLENNLNVAIMLDSKGPEIRSGDLKEPLVLKAGDTVTFTVERKAEYPVGVTEINYDGFINDVTVGDIILVDSGMMNLKIKEITKTDVICEVLEDGKLTSRRHLNIKGKSAQLPPITDKDWEDIDFAIEQKVDFFALSFVNGGSVVRKLKNYFEMKKADIKVIAKIESTDAVENLEDIINETDSVMVARGDLGAELPIEAVPIVQADIVKKCREMGKPVIVATQLLESMMVYPTPTRAEVTDIYFAVRQRTDAIMMSGETASGNYPFKALATMSLVAQNTEGTFEKERDIITKSTNSPKSELANGACLIANNIDAKAIIVFSQTGETARMVSQCRPVSKLYIFAGSESVKRQLALSWGAECFYLPFNEGNPEETIQRAVTLLKENNHLDSGDKVVTVSNILGFNESVHSIQYRDIK